MPHLHRFHVPSAAQFPDEAPLPPDEAHHAIHVVRVRTGDPVSLFDGLGGELDAAISAVTRREVVVRVTGRRQAPKLPKQATLLQGWLKRERHIETLIQRGTEIGLTHFLFFRAEHSEHAPQHTDKWERAAIEACKQCRRAWLPTFDTAPSLEYALARAPETLLVATKDAPPVPLRRTLDARGAGLLVGPEGGLTKAELALALARGATPISLGNNTLRLEVAAIVAATLLLYELGELGPLPDP